MGVPFNVYRLVDRSKQIEGFELIKKLRGNDVMYSECLSLSMDCVIDDYSEWPAGQGFGSSDTTYAIQSFINHVIRYCGLSEELKTTFNPHLCVIKL